jgi:hypothetical protein
MFAFLVAIGPLWLLLALLFKGLLDRSFLSCLVASWCTLHLLWILMRGDPNH